ncbi:GNAT family acetyltransferase [Mollisia scopiformis]|uniref:GNAT family acetyltransferase n=1 Tax=Mollisia scopiformis TaxID=149040 RepID=A0A132B7H1_MOLSC|nr:GNAT family acetyltransferase [Mollisia scopiformis]KUJ08360.1 GNAT family acetyltransferase [Mollisia scopiformis]
MSDPNLKGDFVEGPPAIDPKTKGDIVLKGKHNVILIPCVLEHAPSLFENLCGPQNNSLYTWLPFEPFQDVESLKAHLKLLMSFPTTVFTIFVTEASETGSKPKEAVGITCFMNIVPDNRSIEIGHVFYGPKLSRTPAATEVNYLLMKYAFEELHFQRVEWKTNSFNEASKRAALRLGFTHEGLFRKHMIAKGRRRDTWWASCIDDEWFKKGKGGVKEALEKWLHPDNFDAEGKQKRKLDDIREDGA